MLKRKSFKSGTYHTCTTMFMLKDIYFFYLHLKLYLFLPLHLKLYVLNKILAKVEDIIFVQYALSDNYNFIVKKVFLFNKNMFVNKILSNVEHVIH